VKFHLLENVERKQPKDGKTWRTKIADKFRQPGVPALDAVDSVNPPRVFGVALDKLVPSRDNEVHTYLLMNTVC